MEGRHEVRNGLYLIKMSESLPNVSSPLESKGPNRTRAKTFISFITQLYWSRNVRKCTLGHVRRTTHSLIRIFTGRILHSQRCKVSSGGQWRHWSYCTNVQTGLSQSFFSGQWRHWSYCTDVQTGLSQSFFSGQWRHWSYCTDVQAGLSQSFFSGQWRHWSYCTDVQTDLSQNFFRRTMKTLIKQYGCADWFE